MCTRAQTCHKLQTSQVAHCTLPVATITHRPLRPCGCGDSRVTTHPRARSDGQGVRARKALVTGPSRTRNKGAKQRSSEAAKLRSMKYEA